MTVTTTLPPLCLLGANSVPRISCFERWLWRPLCLPCVSSAPTLCLGYRALNDDCDDHSASIRRPWLRLSIHVDGSAFFLPPLCDLLCLHILSFKGGTMIAGAVTQKQVSLGLGNRWASWSYFGLLKCGTKVAAFCKGGFTQWCPGLFRRLCFGA